MRRDIRRDGPVKESLRGIFPLGRGKLLSFSPPVPHNRDRENRRQGEEDRMELGSQILKIRRERQLTQEDFGRCFHVTRQTVSNWENGGSLR